MAGSAGESSFLHYRDSGAAGGGRLYYCVAVHGIGARVCAAAYRDDAFLRRDLLVVTAERTQDEFQAGIDRKGLG